MVTEKIPTPIDGGVICKVKLIYVVLECDFWIAVLSSDSQEKTATGGARKMSPCIFSLNK